jgi:hypothetical protein
MQITTQFARPTGSRQRTHQLQSACLSTGLSTVADWTVRGVSETRDVVTIEDVRVLASQLPRSYEALVRDRVKFRVGRIVYLAFSRDETIMGFAFPKEEREDLVASEPAKFLMPGTADLRYHWVQVRLSAIDIDEMEELVLDAWRMVVPKSVAAAYLDSLQITDGPPRRD